MTASEPIHMKVSCKNPIRYYIKSALSFLKGVSEDKPAVQELTISGLGNAINVAIACASRIESADLGVIANIKTDYVPVTGAGARACPQIEIQITRSPNADKIVAAEAAAAAEKA